MERVRLKLGAAAFKMADRLILWSPRSWVWWMAGRLMQISKWCERDRAAILQKDKRHG
jgi:hypothetical protein